MRPRGRKVYACVFAISLLSGMAAVFLLIRSYFAVDGIQFLRGQTQRTDIAIYCWSGRLFLGGIGREFSVGSGMETSNSTWTCRRISEDASGGFSPCDYNFAGFGWDFGSVDHKEIGYRATRLDLAIPLGAVALPCLLFAAISWRRLLRPPPGHCRRCGYDLRATPEKCPECGKPSQEIKRGRI